MATSTIADPDGISTFWPWSRRAAFSFAVALFIMLLGGLIVLRRYADWPDVRWEGWLLVAAMLLSLTPIILLVLQSVAASRGSISFRSLTLSFGTVAQAVAASATDLTIAVPRNVTEVGVDISDSGHSQAQAVIREATRADVVVVDLEDGHAWWDSRLLLLCAGAEQHGRPAAVVFVATLHRRHRQFVGWARPSSIVKCLIQADRNLAYAHAIAQVWIRRAGLVLPTKAPEPDGYPPAVVSSIPPAPQNGAPFLTEEMLFDRQANITLPQPPAEALTRALGSALHPLEDGGHVGHLTVTRLRDLLGPVLHVDSVERNASDREWVRAALASDSEYLVVTDAHAYVGLAPQSVLVRSLLESVVLSLAASNHD
jgi:hypothetical protein